MAKRILIVDDDELLRRSLAFNLEQAGYEVSTAASAEDGLEILRLTKHHLIILDIGLPGMDGLDALRKFKDNFELPIIFLTARRRELDEVVGLELGADEYITKPFSIRELIARVKAIFRRMDVNKSKSEDETDVNILDFGDLLIDFEKRKVTLF